MSFLTPNRQHTWAIGLLGLFAGSIGGLPHFLWSREVGQAAWFFNSYDEGFYGWSSLTESPANRLLSSLLLRFFYRLAGENSQLMMVLADILLPAMCASMAYFLVRPIFRCAITTASAALFILIAAECLALRSNLIPHAGWHGYLKENWVPALGGAGGLLQIDNITSTFWLFRTPEPQLGWILMFFTLGGVVRWMLAIDDRLARRQVVVFWAGCVLLGMGYLFCSLTTASVLLLLAVLVWRHHRAVAHHLAAGAVLIIVLNLVLSRLTVSQLGGESFLFASRKPVLLLSSMSGVAAIIICLARWRFAGRLPGGSALSLALGLVTVILPNQQLLTGHMICLVNFENFALPLTAALALMLACSRYCAPVTSTPPHPAPPRLLSHLFAAAAVTVWVFIMAQSQLRSYRQYLEENRRVESYRRALQALPTISAPLVCEDFLASDILAVKLGHRPPFLFARDEIFNRPISRLVDPARLPEEAAPRRQKLYHFLAITGTTPEAFAERLRVLVDPTRTNWQDRTLFGSSLYNPIDHSFWLTHGRANKTDWIARQLPAIAEEYGIFLQKRQFGSILFLSTKSQVELPDGSKLRIIRLGTNLGIPTHPLHAYLIGPPSQS